jgi:hypothetical protein
MIQEEPCCAASAARKVKMLEIDGISVGIARFDEIMSEVRGLGLGSEEEIKRELIRVAKVYNYIPRSAEGKYGRVLFREYLHRVEDEQDKKE